MLQQKWMYLMIDWNRIAVLRDEVGAEDFDEVVELFLDEVEEVITRLRSGVDFGSLEGDLHFLKGSALSLGFEAFSTLCQQGETRSAAGEAEAVDVAEILRSFDASKEVFIAELPSAFAA